jgi:hypothetical protein
MSFSITVSSRNPKAQIPAVTFHSTRLGEYSTISDHKDNVHWFKTTSDTGYIFNIHVLNVDPEIKRSGRVYIDPHGEQLAGGRIKADKLRSADAFRRFG